MFNQCEEKSSFPLERERVVRLMMSFNAPMVAVPRHSVQPTHAYICTFKEDKGLSVYIYLYLTTEKVGVLYRYADEVPGSEGRRIAEDAAVQFAEDMGFLMDDLKFDELDIAQQEKLLATIPMFITKTAVIQEESPTEIMEVMTEGAIETTEAVVEKTVVEAKNREVQPAEEKAWEPEIFLSKFRRRAAAERMKKNKV